MTEYLIASRAAIIFWTSLAVVPAEILLDGIETELERRGVELWGSLLSPAAGAGEKSLELEMTKPIAPLPDPDGSLLLRELSHRVNNELTSTICTISAKAVESDDVAVKAALLDVVDLLHGYADVHRALRMPDPAHLTDAARYLQHLCFSITKYRLNRLGIRLLCSADDLWLEGERCWKLGLIVSELLTNVARHARFDDRHPEAEVKLLLAGNVVRCSVSDNGSASDLVVRGRGLTIIGGLTSSLGGRVHASCAAEGSSFLLTFPLTESEQRAAGATHVVMKRRKMRRSHRLQVSRAEDEAAG